MFEPSLPQSAPPLPDGEQASLLSRLSFRSLRLNVFAAIALTALLLVVLLVFPLQSTILNRFVALEHETLLTNLTRAEEALAAQLTALNKSVRDYAAWDGTYDFMDTLDQGYLEENLTNSVMENTGVNVALIFNPQGQIVLSKTLDFAAGAGYPLPPELSALAAGPLVQFDNDDDTNVGILRAADRTFLLAASPVLPSSGAGPSKGAMIFGHALSPEDITALANTTKLNLSIHRLDLPGALPADVADQLRAGTKEIVQPLSDRQLRGYRVATDLNNQPALAFQVDMERAIYAQGRTGVLYFLGMLVLGAVIFVAVGYLLLGRIVLARVSRLNREVGSITGDGDLIRVTESGHDELSQLSHSINEMLGKIETADGARLQAEEEQNKLNQRLLAARDATLDKLAAPIIPISDTVIVMPLIGDVDDQRADKILHVLLRGINQLRPRTAIIDITGITEANPAVVTLLGRMSGAVHLLGSSLVLTGISAEIAQALADNDDLTDGISTYGNLQQAIVTALRN
ncbi:MAG TPA: CHASE4 domain-containing protein [Herpetosiphonaceae bacterium]